MHKYITYVADRAATREVETMFDFWGLGRLIETGELTYEVAQADMVKAFSERNMQGSTAKVYVSQGYALAQLFDTFADLEDYADAECKGSRSLKRVYDSTRDRSGKSEGGEGEGGDATVTTVKTALVDVVLAALPNLTEAEWVRVVRAIADLNGGVIPVKLAAAA